MTATTRTLVRLRALLRQRRVRLAALVVALAGVAAAAWLIWPFWQLSGKFEDHPTRQPSRLYARSTVLREGDPADFDALVHQLDALGYRETGRGGELPPGRYHRADGVLSVHQRAFPTAQGNAGGEVLRVVHNGRRVRRLELAGEEVRSAPLEPVLLASFYGDDLEERRPVRIEEVPEDLIWAVLAAEDAHFFRHGGISPTGILRAAWVDLRGGGVRQGGSTLTQQLVKNLYLSDERTLSRKVREAVLAVLLEARYTKREILQAYFNEIYLGVSNRVNLIGMGAAAHTFFGKPVSELDLGEAATLAGLIQSPARFNPAAHPEAARERRDWVLSRMVEVGFLEAERAAAVRERPVEVHPLPVVRSRAPYFAAFAAREAEERFGVDELAGAGDQLLSTVDWDDQQEAQEAVTWGVEALEKGWEKGHRGAPLQAALVSVDPRSGAILSYVGGRDFASSQFDRAGMAMRQAGSAFKPVVYAAAFADGKAYPASFLEDAPLTVRLAGQRWTPKNYDGTYHGWVTVRTALEDSLNVASARLALQVGLPRVVEMARQLGIVTPLEPVPSIALGAFEVTPLEMARVYATFAAAGRRPSLYGLSAVLDPLGKPLEAVPVPGPEKTISPDTAYLVTSVLQGVIDHGTAASARRQGVRGALAGKTGTTNGRRDSWFAGYSPDRATVVWVGYDDNADTHLSGSRAAVPIWSRYVVAVRPPGGYPTFPQPPGIVTAVIDPTTGELATEDCPYAITEVYPAGRVPTEVCHVHQRFRWRDLFAGSPDDGAPPGADGRARAEERRREEERSAHPFRRWLRRVFGGGDEEPADDGDEAPADGDG